MVRERAGGAVTATPSLVVINERQVLRNNPAHAGDIVAVNFNEIVRLSENVDRVLAL
jgi:hypothetical protein